MENNLKSENTYSLPMKVYSKPKLWMTLFGVVMSLLFIGMIFIPFEEEGDLFMKIFMICVGIFFFYITVVIHLFKIQYLNLTETYIEYNSGLSKKITLNYSDIYTMNIYELKSNTMLGIISNKRAKEIKAGKFGFVKRLFANEYSLNISMSYFTNLELDKLYTTIKDKVCEVIEESGELSQETFDEDSLVNEFDGYEEKPSGSLPIAIIKTLAVTLVVGVLYGLSMHFFRKNLLLIPILGVMAVLYTYNKSYVEERINYVVRFFIGIFAACQIFIALIVDAFFWNGLPFNLTNLTRLTESLFKEITRDPMDHLVIILIAVVSFYYGFIQGKTFKFQRSFNKLFMKKHGNYYYKRDGKVVDIFLKDPANYDEDEEKYALNIGEGCLIERNKNKVLSFLIPEKYLEEYSIILNSDICKVGEETYKEINLGGSGSYKELLLPCSVIFNANKEAEVIRIQL